MDTGKVRAIQREGDFRLGFDLAPVNALTLVGLAQPIKTMLKWQEVKEDLYVTMGLVFGFAGGAWFVNLFGSVQPAEALGIGLFFGVVFGAIGFAGSILFRVVKAKFVEQAKSGKLD